MRLRWTTIVVASAFRFGSGWLNPAKAQGTGALLDRSLHALLLLLAKCAHTRGPLALGSRRMDRLRSARGRVVNFLVA